MGIKVVHIEMHWVSALIRSKSWTVCVCAQLCKSDCHCLILRSWRVNTHRELNLEWISICVYKQSSVFRLSEREYLGGEVRWISRFVHLCCPFLFLPSLMMTTYTIYFRLYFCLFITVSSFLIFSGHIRK